MTRSSHPRPPQSRESLPTRGLDTRAIPGVVVCEMPNFEQEVRKLETMVKPSYTAEEVYGTCCNHVEHIEAPLDLVMEYAGNVYSLEEFSATVRGIEYVGGGLYKGKDVLAPDTDIFLRLDVYEDSRVIDTMCAWDQPHELWMRYHWRLFDALEVLGKPGTVLLWNNFRHPYYDKASPAPAYVSKPRARTDRMWVGDFWRLFPAAHAVEARNLKLIMERRCGVR